MTIHNDDFPYMTNGQVQAFWSADKKDSLDQTSEDKRVLLIGHSQTDLMYLDDLKESLLKGDELPHSVYEKLEELYETIDAAQYLETIQ